MNTFLSAVAKDLLTKFNNDLSNVYIVCPNRRAGLFMSETFSKSATPVWAPTYLSLSELFEHLSKLNLCDPIETICRLFQIYKQLCHEMCEGTENKESDYGYLTLDSFFPLGEMLLRDFDEIDKALCDTRQLFNHLEDLRVIEAMDTLTSEQKAALRSFFDENIFSNSENESVARRNFRHIWSMMPNLYLRLHETLISEGLAYEGMLQREAAENWSELIINNKDTTIYTFVGFNAFNKVEQRVINTLRKSNTTLFYWDYDVSYTAPNAGNIAGRFVSEGMSLYPGELKEPELFNNLNKDKELCIASAPTDNIQARYAGLWLNNLDLREENERRMTAIVLCDDNILLPLLHSIPDELGPINITKGYPLSQSSIFADVIHILEHTKERSIDTLLQALWEHIEILTLEDINNDEQTGKNTDFNSQLNLEALFQTRGILNRFRLIRERGYLDVGVETFTRLFSQVVRNTSIPFEGKPLQGVQVMGMLETRLLDFKNILILAADEGRMPARPTHKSLIPYFLRKEYGLPTNDDTAAVYAYHFYRLLQRAENVTFVYNNSTQNMRRGEMSRFLTELSINRREPITHINLSANHEVHMENASVIEKSDNLLELINWKLTPSSLNTYLRCQLQFYYQYVKRLNAPEQNDGNIIEPNKFGTVFHSFAEQFYNELASQSTDGQTITAEMLKFQYKLPDSHFHRYSQEAFQAAEIPVNVIAEKVAIYYLRQLIRIDLGITPFKIGPREENNWLEMVINTKDGNEVKLQIGGIIDRQDYIDYNGQLSRRIIDYKTGGEVETFKDIPSLFDADNPKRPKYIFQAFLYSLVAAEHNADSKLPIIPALYFIHQAAKDNYNPIICKKDGKNLTSVTDFINEYATEFREHLNKLIREIISAEQPFVPTTQVKFCEKCQFRYLCKQ